MKIPLDMIELPEAAGRIINKHFWDLLLVVVVTFMMASCAVTPSPAVSSHASGGFIGVGPTGAVGLMNAGQTPVLNMEASKAAAFWGGR